ncbi:fibrinogen C domain-containing protein 1-B-like [Lingula anatina]|uniref:Fibrinogen C domain-containing protein 1-B-like n=1 Tax=Lingula anatina TaxID=7574 RepID=A0A1S3J677_LINAN|nr:fibrinogen C domain-containing protein 1-B-like [Lingula anatina]XP_023933353.1 fibrinogen C domain-containing protein 1-B-like [Lingula anatina]|eukprot:XP_013405895.1 fibrinogen C domain-containing protein 1-B-like [Lingula anatina]
METDGGGWTVVQRREDGLVNFQKTWREYNNGFGDPDSEHWLGLQKMYLLNKNGNTKIRFDLWQFKDNKYSYAEYKKFKLSDESDRYRLRIGRYSGTAGDSFHYGHYYLRHNGQRFSTFDLDNDASSSRNCAQLYHGGWWFANCMASNLNGIYYVGHQNGEYQSYTRDGIMWQTLDGYRSLMETEIKVRPAKFKCC